MSNSAVILEIAACLLLMISVHAAESVPTEIQMPGTQPGEAANFEFNWTKGGVIRQVKGLPFRLARSTMLRNAWTLEKMDGKVLFEMEVNMNWFKQDAHVLLHTTSEETKELDLLLPMCMYLTVSALRKPAPDFSETEALTI